MTSFLERCDKETMEHILKETNNQFDNILKEGVPE